MDGEKKLLSLTPRDNTDNVWLGLVYYNKPYLDLRDICIYQLALPYEMSLHIFVSFQPPYYISLAVAFCFIFLSTHASRRNALFFIACVYVLHIFSAMEASRSSRVYVWPYWKILISRVLRLYLLGLLDIGVFADIADKERHWRNSRGKITFIFESIEEWGFFDSAFRLWLHNVSGICYLLYMLVFLIEIPQTSVFLYRNI